MAWDIVLAASSVIVGIAALLAIVRPLAGNMARREAGELRRKLNEKEFRGIEERFDQLEARLTGRIERSETRVNGRIDRLDQRTKQLEVRVTAAISEIRADLGTVHENQGRILEAIRALSPVGVPGETR